MLRIVETYNKSKIANSKSSALQALADFGEIFVGSRRGIQDTIISMLPHLVRLCTGVLAAVLLARGLGPAGLGQYALVLSVSEVSMSLADLGIGQTALRYASRAVAAGDSGSQRAALRWAFQRRIFLAALTSLVAYLLAPTLASQVWHMPELSPLIRLGLLIGLFGSLAHIPSLYFQSLQRFGMNASVLIGQALISLLGIVILAVSHYWSVRAVVLVSVVTAGVGALAFLLLIPKTVLFSDWPNIFPLRRTATELWGSLAAPAVEDSNVDDVESVSTFAFFMFLSSLFVMLTLKADVWLMGVFLDKESIGVYSVAQRFTLPLAIVLAALSTTLWPRASSLSTDQGVRALLARTLKVCFLIALLGCAYSLLIPFLAPYLFGKIYETSVLPGQILCIGYIIAILVCPIGIIGYSMGLGRVYWLVNLIQFILVVVLLIILLPVNGPVGAAVAFAANAATGGAIVGHLFWRKVKTSPVAVGGTP